MSITPEDVKHIAALARLGLTDEEIKQAAKNLSNILDHFSQIQAIDTTNVPTYDNATGLTNVTREDKAEPDAHGTCQTLLKAAPNTKDGHIKVPAVLN